jgi:hypothetical protein
MIALHTYLRLSIAASGLAAVLVAPVAAQMAGGNAEIEPSADQSSIYRRDTGINDSGNYKQEVQACLAGRTQQARETCMEEARNARAAQRRGELSAGSENFTGNAMARCRPLSGEYKAACEARVMGFGTASGSVAGGGLLREVEIVMVPPGTDRVRIQPETPNPVVLVPSK